MRLLGGKHAGYTVLEVMIFLAVSLLLFVAAMTAIGGRQAQVQFTQGVRDFDSQLQDIINDVATGYFPNTTTSCEVDGVGNIQLTTVATAEQGANEDCVFLGKVVQFGADTSDQQVNIVTVVGRRLANGSQVTSLTDANPTAAAPTSSSGVGFPNLTEDITLSAGIRVSRVARPTGSIQDFGSVAFMSNFGALAPSSSYLNSGSSNTTFAPVAGTGLANTAAQAVDLINDMTTANTVVNPSEGIVICLTDGSRRASITLGSSSGGSVTRIDFDTYNKAVCGS